MIIHVIGKWGRDEYIVCPRAPVSVTELHTRMLQRSKVVEGSYAYRLIDDLHSAIFLQSLDLKLDYETYFVQEYKSFGEYLRRRQRLPTEVVAALTQSIDASSGMYHFQPWQAFLANSYGTGFLTRLLENPPAKEAS